MGRVEKCLVEVSEEDDENVASGRSLANPSLDFEGLTIVACCGETIFSVNTGAGRWFGSAVKFSKSKIMLKITQTLAKKTIIKNENGLR